jgi:GNAT superfamily N-acetyltransferase
MTAPQLDTATVYFLQPFPEIDVYEILDGDVTYLDEMITVFQRVFPQFSFSIPVMRQYAFAPADWHPLFWMHQWIIRVNEQPAGMTTFMYHPRRNLGFGLYLALAPEFRKHPIGSYPSLAPLIINLTRQQIRSDALRYGNPPPNGYVAEVVDPPLINFYKRHGFTVFPVEYYVAPIAGPRHVPLTAEELAEIDFHTDFLGVFAEPERPIDLADSAYLANVITMLCCDFYGIPPDHWAVQKALASLPGQPDQLPPGL